MSWPRTDKPLRSPRMQRNDRAHISEHQKNPPQPRIAIHAPYVLDVSHHRLSHDSCPPFPFYGHVSTHAIFKTNPGRPKCFVTRTSAAICLRPGNLPTLSNEPGRAALIQDRRWLTLSSALHLIQDEIKTRGTSCGGCLTRWTLFEHLSRPPLSVCRLTCKRTSRSFSL